MRPHRPPRTRGQWDGYFKTLCSSGKGEVKGSSDSGSSSSDENYAKSTSGFVWIHDRDKGGVESIRVGSSSKSGNFKRGKRSGGKEKGRKPLGRRKKKDEYVVLETVNVKEEKESSVSRIPDFILLSDDDDDDDDDVEVVSSVCVIGEEVLSNGSNVKVKSEARSGCCSKVDAVEFVSGARAENSSSVDAACSRDPGDSFETADAVFSRDPGDSFGNADVACSRHPGGSFENADAAFSRDPGDSFGNADAACSRDPGDSFENADGPTKTDATIFDVESSEEDVELSDDEDYEVDGPSVSIDSEISDTESSSFDRDETSDDEGSLETRVRNPASDTKEHGKRPHLSLVDEDASTEENNEDGDGNNGQDDAATMPKNRKKSSPVRSSKGGSTKNRTSANKKAADNLKSCGSRKSSFKDENVRHERRKQACCTPRKEVLPEKNGRPDSLEKEQHSTSVDDQTESSEEEELNQSNKRVKKGVNPGKDHVARNLDMAKILLESIYSAMEGRSQASGVTLDQEIFPSKFCFEDEVEKPPEKSEWDHHVDSLFRELELCLRLDKSDDIDEACSSEAEIGGYEPIIIDESPAACCGRGEHQLYFDEEIGILCKYCSLIVLDVKHVIAPFHTPPPNRRNRTYENDESPASAFDEINFRGSSHEAPNSTSQASGTVWDLISGIQDDLYPHQREGFEFMWKIIAGDIKLENLKQPLSSGGRGCIISHAPGTGKTRLSVVFLHSYLKLYPACCPVIIAPRGMLLTWESEFKKWKVDIPFHNMNKKELSGNENAEASKVALRVGNCRMSKVCIRLLKLYSWTKNPSVLGISYTLFKKIVENDQEQLHGHMKEILLEYPGLLILDEGHTPRNDQSLLWNAFMKVSTPRRIILSGTPFQNNLTELYNTLCLVNPMFERQMRNETRGKKRIEAKRNWTDLTSSIGKCSDDGLKKLKEMLHSFVHVHKGTILEESIPGLRCTMVFLHPTERQKTMLKTAASVKNTFCSIRLVSLVSVHPSLMANTSLFSSYKSELEELESDIDAGVKLKFLLELISLADALGERVLIFSQFLDPLSFIKKHIESRFSWNEGREVLYMDGGLNERMRQHSISSFNDGSSEAKVLLASERACSEGINLIGASRLVLLDTVWNPSVEKQAVSRAYRLGQKRVVYVYRLFTSGTEVRQYERQVQKERMSELIFSPLDGQHCPCDKTQVGWEDQILDSLRELDGVRNIFERIVQQKKEADFVQNFGLADGR